MTMEGTDGKKFLAPISILTVPTYTARKKVMDACSRAVVRYWHEVKDEPRHEKDGAGDKEKQKAGAGEQSAGSQDVPGKASDDHPKDDDMGEESKASQPSQTVWEIKTWNWNLPINMAPGITQFERRLGAPLHGLMNATSGSSPASRRRPWCRDGRPSSWRTKRALGWEESFTAARPQASQERQVRWRIGSPAACRAYGPHRVTSGTIS